MWPVPFTVRPVHAGHATCALGVVQVWRMRGACEVRSGGACELVGEPTSCLCIRPRRSTSVISTLLLPSQVAPWSKTGGLGDVMGALPRALAARGHRVMVVGCLVLVWT